LSQSELPVLTIEELFTGARLLLDLGASPNSPAQNIPARHVRLDEHFFPTLTVQARATALPFKPHCFEAILANHSFEHFQNLPAALAEVARTITPEGTLYVAVPFGPTLSDRLYRALFQGGGHVQYFQSQHHVISIIETHTGLPCIAATPIHSAFHFLTGPDIPGLPRRIRLWLQFWTPTLTMLLVFCLSALERLGLSSLRLYGASFVFSRSRTPFTLEPRHYTCCQCGTNFSRAWLEGRGAFEQSPLLTHFTCTNCQRRNHLFTPPP
jgi:SAM-dependent methyltransferase